MFFTFVLLILCVVPVSAAKEVKFRGVSLNATLYSFEMNKEHLGLSKVDFNKLKIGDAIKSYVYSLDGLNESYEYYPLFLHPLLCGSPP